MLTLHEVASMTGGLVVAPPGRALAAVDATTIEGVSTDSRNVGDGTLFVALSGDRFDGHAFVETAARAGARAALIEHGRDAGILPSVTVPDVRRALGDLAAGWRTRQTLPLVVVTGSNGKTTTKEMVAAILVAAYGGDAVCATRGNLNNDIGVPLTLLRLRPTHRVAVVEVGMNHPGETARLVAIAAPDVALVVNAQREHQEFMQTVAAVAEEHALAIAALGVDGVAVFPADDPHAAVWRRAAGCRRVVDFACAVSDTPAGDASAATVTGRADLTADGSVLHLRVSAGGAVAARLTVPGRHNAHNATAAAAVGVALGIPLQTIAAGLEAFRPVTGRTQRVVVAGVVVIDDSYNANPDSMRAAIDLLASHGGSRLMVMGDMGEVGDDGPRFHAEIGAYAREQGIDALYALGTASRAGVDAFGIAGRHFATVEPLIAAVNDWVDARRGDAAGAVVVKGSRFMRMERVVAALRDRDGDAVAMSVAAEGAH